ncbi:hypothetical protein MTO96_030541 [Rhipicephalus appendiculatus]
MPKGRPPGNTARREEAPAISDENKASVLRARRRPFLVRLLRRPITLKAVAVVVNAVLLIAIVQLLYLANMGAFKVKQRTNVIRDSRSSDEALLNNTQQENEQLNLTALPTPAPPARSDAVTMLCTVGSQLPQQVPVYPADGSHSAWLYFRRHVGMYNRTRLLPSLEWARFRKTPGEGLNASQARSLNRTLVNAGMTGLSMLNVLADVRDLRSLSRVLATLAAANQGMFLALGLRLLGLLDRTATRIVPADVLDALLTPLSLFVLETHLPVAEQTCVTAPLTPLIPYGSQPRPTLTFRGVKAFFSQPAVRLIHPNATGRCVSFLAGAVHFDVTGVHAASTDNSSNNIVPTRPRESSQPRHVHRPGEPCHSWSLVPVQFVCDQKLVTHITDAVAWYASSEGNFVAYDTWETFLHKAQHVLMDHLESEIPTCLALYSVDMVPARLSCAAFLHSSRGAGPCGR